MSKGICLAVLFGTLVAAPVSAEAAACFNPGPGGASFVTMAIELAGGTAPFFGLVGEVVTNTAQGRVSWPVTGSVFVRANGTAPFALLGAFGAVTGTLNPPGYDRGSVQGTQGSVAITAVACPPLPE
jgi:hypothetical protein